MNRSLPQVGAAYINIATVSGVFEMKTVRDSMGELELPDDTLYGAQTARAVANFQFNGSRVHSRLIRAIVQIKAACARANKTLETLPAVKADAIESACAQIQDFDQPDLFPVSVYQTGSGTSSNMNVNEVLATLASRTCSTPVHPNDDVNRSQSSNDVFPSAIRIAAVEALDTKLLPSLKHLIQQIEQQRRKVGNSVKTGRTHLMDAMPITFDQEMSGWQTALERVAENLKMARTRQLELPQGGTAVGTGVNSPAGFAAEFCTQLNQMLSSEFKPADNAFYGMAFQEDSAFLAATLKSLANVLLKISDDLRWMNSGPLTGLGDIQLKALQPGSSIMPGKVNPVIPEAVMMVCYTVIGQETTISAAQRSSQFQLNVALPIIGNTLLEMMTLLSDACRHLADKAIADFVVNTAEIDKALAANPILATALNDRIGYDQAAKIAKQAYKERRSILSVAEEHLEIPRSELEQLLNAGKLARPHKA